MLINLSIPTATYDYTDTHTYTWIYIRGKRILKFSLVPPTRLVKLLLVL